jgi:hypothetical protein
MQLNPGQQGQGQQGQGQQGQQGQGQQGHGQQGQGQQGQPGQPGENGDGNGARAGLDLSKMEAQLKTMSAEDWGRLPGHLRTEILQRDQKRPNSDYAKLIKLYFRDIAKKEQQARQKTGGR